MGSASSRWSFENKGRMEDLIKAGKTWHVMQKYFPDRSMQSIQAQYFAVKANGVRRARDDGPLKAVKLSAIKQDNAFRDAMIRGGCELNRQVSVAQGRKPE